MTSLGFSALASAWRRVPELSALALVVFLPLVVNPFSSEPFEATKVAFLRWISAVMVLAFFTGRGSNGRLARGTRIDIAVLVYSTVHLIATGLSMNPRLSFWGGHDQHGTFTLLSIVAVFFVVSRTPTATSSLVGGVLLGTVPVATYGIAQFLGLDPLTWVTDSVSPMLSTMGRSNFLGAYMAMVVPLTLTRIVTRCGRGGWRSWVLLTLQVAMVVLSQARAAWLGLVGGAVVFVALLAFRRKSSALGTLSLILLLLGLVLFRPWSRLDWSSDRDLAELRAGTVDSRLAIWGCTLSLARDRWLMGYGPETFVVVFGSRCPIAPPGWIVDDPHNLVLDELVAAGAFGVVGFGFLVVAFFTTVVRSLRAESDRFSEALWAGLAGSLAAFLVQAQFNPDVIVLSVLFWLVLAIASANAPSGSRAGE